MNVPYVNIIGCGVNNPSCQIDVHECTGRAAADGMKCECYLARILVPIIRNIEKEKDQFGRSLVGCIDVVYGDGASNMKMCGDVLMETFPRITAIHGTEHVISLFFQDVFTKILEYKLLAEIAKVFRNIFGSTRHVPKAMFDGYSLKHNRGIMVGFKFKLLHQAI